MSPQNEFQKPFKPESLLIIGCFREFYQVGVLMPGYISVYFELFETLSEVLCKVDFIYAKAISTRWVQKPIWICSSVVANQHKTNCEPRNLIASSLDSFEARSQQSGWLGI